MDAAPTPTPATATAQATTEQKHYFMLSFSGSLAPGVEVDDISVAMQRMGVFVIGAPHVTTPLATHAAADPSIASAARTYKGYGFVSPSPVPFEVCHMYFRQRINSGHVTAEVLEFVKQQMAEFVASGGGGSSSPLPSHTAVTASMPTFKEIHDTAAVYSLLSSHMGLQRQLGAVYKELADMKVTMATMKDKLEEQIKEIGKLKKENAELLKGTRQP